MADAISSPPTVTVIVPVRDRAGMLRDLLESLLTQDYPASRMELIVVDGDSRDAIAEIVGEYARHAPFAVRYLQIGDDRGPVPKRNLGARNANGEILAFTDSDCRTTPGWLSALVAPFRERDVAFCSGPVTYKPEQKKEFFSKLTAETLVEHPTYPTANVAYRRDLFLAAGGFAENLGIRDFLGRATECGDSDLAWRLKREGHRNVFVPEALILHEVEALTPFLWLMEPTRLILLPLLLKLHPEIGPRLLRWNLVFYPMTLVAYATFVMVPLLLILAPKALPWLLAVGVVLLWLWKSRSLAPRRNWQVLQVAILHFLRLVVMAATLIAGSIRYGRLVL